MYGADACSTNLQSKSDSSLGCFSTTSKSSDAVRWIMTATQQPHSVTCSVCVWFCLLNATQMNWHVTSVCVQWGVTTEVKYQQAVVCSISVYVCLRPLGATGGDNVSCPLRPHLHHHPSWCHLSWPRTKLSPWEKLACRAPCSDSTQPCPAPTHACSPCALLALIRASFSGLCTHRKTRSNRRERRCWWSP